MTKSADSLLNKDRSGFVWNIIGSTIYAAANMLFGTTAMRILGADLGGLFFFAFSTIGQHIFIVAYFGMRPLQITDMDFGHSFGDYKKFRYITCAAAFLCAVIFAVIYAGLTLKTTTIIIMAIYKILDAIADVYECEYQREGRLDLTGKSLTIRTLFVAVCFVVAMLLTGDLVISCVTMVVALTIAILVYCVSQMKRFATVDYTIHRGTTKDLFEDGRWLFLTAFFDLYVLAASKYAIDYTCSAEVSGYYSTIFAPTNVVFMMANFIIRPVLTDLSALYEKGDWDAMKKIAIKIGTMIAGLTIFGMVFSWLLGVQCLTILVGAETGAALMNYRLALVIIIAGGGMYALLSLFYYILIVLKKQKQICIIYAIAVVPTFIICKLFVDWWSLTGGAIAYLTSMVLIAIAFIGLTKNNWEKN